METVRGDGEPGDGAPDPIRVTGTYAGGGRPIPTHPPTPSCWWPPHRQISWRM